MPSLRRLSAAALLLAAATTAAAAQSPSTRGNNTVPILTAMSSGPDCASSFAAAPSLAAVAPFRQVFAAYPALAPADGRAEFVMSCFDGAALDALSFVSSRAQASLVRSGDLGSLAGEITRLAARHPKHKVLIAGYRDTAAAARELARRLPCWVDADVITRR